MAYGLENIDITDNNINDLIRLEELIENRNSMIDAHRKNNFTDGIHALLTDLYPDEAHFIYELLQNAEDMNATCVKFNLNNNGMVFMHNGTKREFNVDDIDAITNIGHNAQKKNDPTSIGKFGVGFKAVFAYTTTPIIHSGIYHFRIKDYFVPDFENVESKNTISEDGTRWTIFEFPFNNPKKPVSRALEECRIGLAKLDTYSLLFLQHISKIEYKLPNGFSGYIQRTELDDNIITISKCDLHKKRTERSQWLRFCRSVNIVDDQGKQKSFPIGIAFAYNDNRIVPVKGKTFIYFPAEKEHSGLRFHINALFASTVARDSIRCFEEGNLQLIEEISKLLVDSLPYIKKLGLMDHQFFEVLPYEGELSTFYSCFFRRVSYAFAENEYLPTTLHNGERQYVNSKEALLGPRSISELFTAQDFTRLTGKKKVWISNASQRNSNADKFIRSLGITNFDYNDFSELFNSNFKSRLENFVKDKNIDWLRKFYILCETAMNNLNDSSTDTFTQDLLCCKFIRSSTGKMYLPSEIYILPDNVELITPETTIVDIQLTSTKDKKNGNINQRIVNFFNWHLRIKEYGPAVEIKKKLNTYIGKSSIETFSLEEEQYYNDMLTFAKYSKEHSDISFTDKNIFCCANSTNSPKSTCKLTRASSLFINSSDGKSLAKFYSMNCINDSYLDHYDDDQQDLFLDFAFSCGLRDGLTIEKRSAEYNPLYWSKLSSDKRHTENGVDIDFTVWRLEDLLKNIDEDGAMLIWHLLMNPGSKYKSDINQWHGSLMGGYGYRTLKIDYSKAMYSNNGQDNVRTCDSTLIYYLKKYKWLPNKHGELYRPADIRVSDLNGKFKYNSDNPLISALQIGSSFAEQERKLRSLEKEADKLDCVIISKADKAQFDAWKAKQDVKNTNQPRSAKDLIESQSKKSKPSPNNQSVSFAGPVKDASREALINEAAFKNSQKMPKPKRALFSKVIASSKDERAYLFKCYNGKCQMCGMSIITYENRPYFASINFIDTSILTDNIRSTVSLGWNSLCLCPNCAAKYRVCSRDLSMLYNAILNRKVAKTEATIDISFKLSDSKQKIHYVPKHFLALQTALRMIDKEYLSTQLKK